jgi:hypothetical protein
MISLMLRAGLLCLAGVVLIRSAEHFQWVPIMGWGPDSPAHYLALTGAAVGLALLMAGVMLGWLRIKMARAR